MEVQRVIFTNEKKTKNTIRYSEQANGKPPAIGSLYVQKWLLGTDHRKDWLSPSRKDRNNSEVTF